MEVPVFACQADVKRLALSLEMPDFPKQSLVNRFPSMCLVLSALGFPMRYRQLSCLRSVYKQEKKFWQQLNFGLSAAAPIVLNLLPMLQFLITHLFQQVQHSQRHGVSRMLERVDGLASILYILWEESRVGIFIRCQTYKKLFILIRPLTSP